MYDLIDPEVAKISISEFSNLNEQKKPAYRRSMALEDHQQEKKENQTSQIIAGLNEEYKAPGSLGGQQELQIDYEDLLRAIKSMENRKQSKLVLWFGNF